jgi:hypothetical protein
VALREREEGEAGLVDDAGGETVLAADWRPRRIGGKSGRGVGLGQRGGRAGRGGGNRQRRLGRTYGRPRRLRRAADLRRGWTEDGGDGEDLDG